ncbi:hypothetical protein GE09DRAFT_965280 [Coniochaeta sp. 2T2.1]|nr:hypothetical protein GE09DRAFT_965280 [Coniochaeta sp. 2T2.1]
MLSADEEDRTLVPTPADRRSSSSLGSRQYKLIAPRPGTVKTPSDGSSPGMLGHRIRKKRAPYTATNRFDTNLTRSLNACVRCRIQRNRCIPDPNNPRGPCQSCQNKKSRLSRLPCLRYKLSDSILFRTGLDYMTFYKSHPMTGPRYGDFHIEKTWIDGPGRYLCLSQDRGSFLRIELRQFVPPNDPTALDLKGRSMYAANWAIADPDAVTEALNEFINNSLGYYLDSILDDTDGLVWDVFHAAIRSSVFPQPNLLLRQTLRLWVVCRFIESRWRCWTDQEEEDITQQFPGDPFYDWMSPPPYVDYQFASIIIHRVLTPLREEILRELEKMVEKHKPEDWYVTFLTAFILLHNYELQMQFQRDFARRRRAPVRNQPFGEKFDWNSSKNRRMARLDAEQSRFMAGYRDRVIAKGKPPHSPLLRLCGTNHDSAPKRTSTFRSPNVHEWPQVMRGDLAWDASALPSEEEMILTLTEDEIDEVKGAVQYFNQLGLYGSEVSASNFPLPTLGEKLLKSALDIHRGRGFAIIRGLDPKDFSLEDNLIVFLGVSSYIGSQRGRQDEDGNMLMHIRDAKRSKAPQKDRPTRYSSRASTFHTDTFCDILALQTRECAARGGRNILASSWTVYNQLAATRPDLARLLAEPIWPFDSRGRFFESSTRPLLYYHGQKVMLNFAREPLLGLDGVRRAQGLATLSPKQREALDLIEQIAGENQLVVSAEPGDLFFINNHGVLHSREAFEDKADNGGPSRYLVRMWLRHPALAWKLPRALQEGNSRIYDDNELGERWNIVDVPKVQFRLSERLTS